MEEEDIEKMRRKRTEQAQQQNEMDGKMKTALRQMLEPDAYERMMNIKAADPEKYTNVTVMLARLFQSGKFGGKVSDQQLVQLLSKMGEKKGGSIQIKRK